MAIDSLSDGFVRLCFDPSANILGDKCSLVLEGQFAPPVGSAIVADQLVKVTNARTLDDDFGAGSVLAEALRTAINCCGNEGVEIFALPRNDLVGSSPAVYSLAFFGPATGYGRVDIYWGDSRWNISVPVVPGDTEADIAAAVVAAIDPSFPYSASSSAGVITLVAKNLGEIGNGLNAQINWHGRNNYFPEGVTYAWAQTSVGAGAPLPLDYKTVLGECCVCCYALLSGNAAWQRGVIDYLDEAWSCDKPQCFGHGYTFNQGSLGTILASDTNSATMSRMAIGVNDPILPWMKVAAYAAQSCCLTVDNPEISIQGPNYGVLSCLRQPESCTNDFTFDEREQLDESGFVVTIPVSGGKGAMTSPKIVNDITNNRFDSEGRENLTFRSVSSRRLATVTATLVAEQLQQFNGLGYYTKNTTIRQGAHGTNSKMILGVMRAWAKSQVGALFSEFEDLNRDLTIQDDFEVAPRCQGEPGKMYMNLVYRPPVRVKRVVVNAAPKLLSNC